MEIPDYQLLRRIGKGGYGEVWLARALTGEYRALKIVQRARFDEDKHYEREFNGIQAYSPVSRSHPGLIPVYHVGRDDERGFFYYVMELADDLSGEHPPDHPGYTPHTLAATQTPGKPLPFEITLTTGCVLAEALAHLHAAGLIHRDLKPANIVYLKGKPRLADPGLVAQVGATTFVGTLGYLPPEGPGHPSADCFALGKLLYEISTGQNHAAFPRLPEIARTPEWPREARRLNQVITTACAIDPTQRYESATDLAQDIRRVDTRRPLRAARQRRRTLALAATLTLTATGLWFAFANSSENSSGNTNAIIPKSPPKPIAHFPLDGNGQNMSGNLNGQIIGATAVLDRHGKKNGAMLFDGLDDAIFAPDETFKSTQFTLSAWFRLDDWSNSTDDYFQVIVGKYYGGMLWYDHHMKTLRISFINDQPYTYDNVLNGGLKWKPELNKWYHAVGTFGGSGTTLRIYIDGELVSESSPIQEHPLLKKEKLGIGRWGDSPGKRFFKGAIDDVRVYDKALSHAEILSLNKNSD